MHLLQIFWAKVITHIFENPNLRKILESLWPRLKTLRLARDLRAQGLLDEQIFRNLQKVRVFRHVYLNLFALIPFGGCVLLFIASLFYHAPSTKNIVAVLIPVSGIYFMLREDGKDEWQQVNLMTNGQRLKGQVIHYRKNATGSAMGASVDVIFDENTRKICHMFLWYGVAPNFNFTLGDMVEVAWLPEWPNRCIIVTPETEDLNVRKEQ